MRRQLTFVFAGAVVIALLSYANVNLAATECYKECGCGGEVETGESPSLSCPYQWMCMFTECDRARPECEGWSYPTYNNACAMPMSCGSCSA